MSAPAVGWAFRWMVLREVSFHYAWVGAVASFRVADLDDFVED
jgi:hypothetical protein